MDALTPLQKIYTSPEHRVIFQANVYWMTIRSFSPSNRMLLEVSCNKNLPNTHQLTPEQLKHLELLELKPRRQGYSLGRLFTLNSTEELEQLSKLVANIFREVFCIEENTIQTSVVPSPSIQVFNRTLIGQMKQLARSKDHQLRLNMYTTLLDASLIALVHTDGTLQKCDTIGNFDCFGAFTDEKHALQYDPRGQNLREMPMLQILKHAITQNAGSLWLNPKGETRGELYKSELDSLWSRVKRFV